ncbi:hypothetical protein AVEN_37741-1 [Araneus ventricosus]|uniref:Uncharacterized protein n=1 Tax=Araneus ventricosus TaxID=182803 RepID=A0A4Y2BU79_ARAVE|nr:hypothetical protein AVEN_37741-1 [Araneus ventricosus]
MPFSQKNSKEHCDEQGSDAGNRFLKSFSKPLRGESTTLNEPYVKKDQISRAHRSAQFGEQSRNSTLHLMISLALLEGGEAGSNCQNIPRLGFDPFWDNGGLVHPGIKFSDKMYDFPDIQFRLSTAVKHEIESSADYSVSLTFLCAHN